MIKNYSNFVKPCSSAQYKDPERTISCTLLTGEEAKKIYLNEVKIVTVPETNVLGDATIIIYKEKPNKHFLNQLNSKEVSDRDLFMSVQNDDVDTLKQALNVCPDKINRLDDYGWSLLMIACQAGSIEVFMELIKRGIDTTVRDKAGNSVQSLIIKNKNYKLADLLLKSKNSKKQKNVSKKNAHHKVDKATVYFCEICNVKVAVRKNDHLSSTIHNINLSKGKKIPTNYIIPETNRGYQIMLKVGWDKETGLGPGGNGSKYPIKTVQKKDRKGLGCGKRPLETKEKEETVRLKNKRTMAKDFEHNKNMEISFRRQFY